MEEKHKSFYVSVKAALYSDDKKSVVVTHILIGQAGEAYGIPGGHIEAKEQPEAALRRELEEELGVEVGSLTIKDTFLHRNGKVIIGYVGEIPARTVFTSPDEMIERGEWKTCEEVQLIDLGSYRDFVINNWPA